ncbi:MAG: hypothetical protein JO348_05350 [Alphaproteobacteria bacterium]|nr:hypothetical protein [Alphaproteobacteria bacterium]MBV9419180.1 hypothetical protein [Alphaproteobacteria bacterium]MBV9539791.1 hypothetical protein [Alphaproteobacteria bacterium]MBV9905033.1 hypothetical protein [Alphaproteobacteria bacterium]
MRRPLIAAVLIATLGSAAIAADPGLPMTPREAVFGAADAAPQGVAGVFRLSIKATGHQDGHVYLNSEADYRDQRNLSIDLCPVALPGLIKKFGSDPERFFLGKDIDVRGVAERVKIIFLAYGVPTEKYYYQTHVVVCSADQITLVQPQS